MLSLDTVPSGTVKYSIYVIIVLSCRLFGARHLQRARVRGHGGVLLVEQTLQCAALGYLIPGDILLLLYTLRD